MTSEANDLITNENFLKIIDKWSNLAFYDNSLNRYSLNLAKNNYYELYQFTIAAEQLVKNNLGRHSYTMIVFNIHTPNDMYHALKSDSIPAFKDLTIQVASALGTHLPTQTLYCAMNIDTYAILLEDYKPVDTALLVINLTEDITNHYPDSKLRLTFGSCEADAYEYDIPSMCRRAFYAMSTITGDDPQLMVDYNEIILEKKIIG